MAQSTCSTPDAVAAGPAAIASAASRGNVAGAQPPPAPPPPPKTGAMEPYDATGATTTTATAMDLREIAARAGASEDSVVAPVAGSASASPAPTVPPKDKQDGDAGADGDGDAAAAAASAALGGPPDEAGGGDAKKPRWRADVDWAAWRAKARGLALRAKVWPEPGARRLPVPAMVVLGAFVGAVGSLVAVAFEEILHGLVHLIWDIIFTRYRESIPASVPGWTFIVFTTPIILAFFAVATAVIPPSWVGVMPDLLRHIHSDEPHMPWQWAVSMFVMSIITLIAGVPLGPELPVLVISSTIGHLMVGWLAFTAPVRRVLIMATAVGALSAFFMVPVGAIFFVLEVPHTLGLEYYEVIPTAAAAAVAGGMVASAIFTEQLGGRFHFPDTTQEVQSDAAAIFWCVVLGMISGVIMYGFYYLYKFFTWGVSRAKLDKRAQLRIAVGTAGLVLLFILVPATMFWGTMELQFILNDSAATLPIYKGDWQGIIPLPLVNDDDPNTPRLAHWSYLIICVFKLIGIAWSMAFRFRGGVIYPLIYAGAAFGRALGDLSVLPSVSVTTITLATSVGFVTSATKTPIGIGIVMALAVTLTGQAKGFDMVILSVAAGYSAVFTTAAIKFYDSQGPRNSQPPCLVESAGDALPTVRPKEAEPADEPAPATAAVAADDDPAAAAGAMSPATMIEMRALSVDGAAAATATGGPLDDPAPAAADAPAQAAEADV